MQSNGNSLYGDVVLDGVNMAYRDEDNIFTKYMRGKYFIIILSWRFQILHRVIEENRYLKKYSTLQGTPKIKISDSLMLVYFFIWC